MRGKPRIILAHPDGEYLEGLELRFAAAYGNRIELSAITDRSFFDHYFSEQQTADLLVVSEGWYSESLGRHEIYRILVLSEREELPGPQEKLVWMNQYGNVKSILLEGMHGIQTAGKAAGAGQTKVIGVCSAVGGSGKTLLAMSLARCLSDQYSRVLYINTEEVQAFSFHLQDKRCLNASAARILREKEVNHYEQLKPHLRREGFTYLPPLATTFASLQIPRSVYPTLLKEVRAGGDFDFVILDMDGCCDEDSALLINRCDYVLIVVMQDEFSAAKTGFLLNNLDCGDREKFLFVCSRFDPKAKNALPGQPYSITAYVEQFSEAPTVPRMCESDEVKNLTWAFL